MRSLIGLAQYPKEKPGKSNKHVDDFGALFVQIEYACLPFITSNATVSSGRPGNI